MIFEHPNVLWAFLLLVIPIIIHLFHFKRFKTLFFSSLIFVKQTQQETKSVKKLKHLLILICRLLAFSALVLAFSKPYFPSEDQNTIGKITAIYIDNSFSMTNLASSGPLFELAKGQAHQIVLQSPDDQSFYIFSNDQTGLEQRKYSKAEAVQRIDHLTISPFSRDFIESANWIQTQVEKENEQKINQLIYISDFQKQDLDKDLILNKATQIYPIQITAQKKTNLSIDSAWFTNTNFRLGAQNELHIIVHNYGKEKIENLALNFKTNQTKRNIFINIRGNDTTEVVVNYMDTKPNWVSGTMSILDEGITFDDELYFSYLPQASNNLVIIDGQDAVPNIQQVYQLDKYYKINNLNEKNIDNQILNSANTIILNGLNSYPSGLIEKLRNKAKEGVGIGIFPGKNPNLNEINFLLKAIHLSSITGKKMEKFKINQINAKDLFFKGVFSKIPKTISLPTQNFYFDLDKSGNSLALLTLENDSPILVRSTVGNAFLFAGALAKDAGNFTQDPIFSTSLLRIGEMSSSSKPIYLTIGENTKYPIEQSNFEVPIRLSNAKFEFIPFKTTVMNRSLISVQQIPDKQVAAGQYSIYENQFTLGILSLNYNRKESKLDFIPADQVAQKLNDKGFKKVISSSIYNMTTLTPISRNGSNNYWKHLLLLALLFLVIEMSLIKFWK